MGLKKRSDLHWTRKIWHIVAVAMMFMVYRISPPLVSKVCIILAWLLFVPLDYMRLSRPALNTRLTNWFGPIMRESEKHKLAGTTYLLTGVLIVIFAFRPPVVSLTLLFLAFADPVASAIGIKYGKDKIFGHKTLQGFLAAFFICFLLCWFFLVAMELDIYRTLAFSLIAGLIAALSELIPIGRMDDNFTLPVISAIGLHFLFYFFGFYPVLG
ncbi:MAG: hypothetical protein V4736_08900 [Bdellovibrionota bacterium]